ncbi:MAG: hypothetical protein EXS19_05815, partial [Pedosphaera sp.]|nr:hypothetical protein [Pedosphaera sp.]
MPSARHGADTRAVVSEQPVLFLGIEGGGTRTVALLADAAGHLLKRAESGPANVRLLTDAQLLRHFREIAKSFPRPAAVGIGLAGARDEKDRERIRRAAAIAWPRLPCHATNDLETALAAGSSLFKGQNPKPRRTGHGAARASDETSSGAQVLVLSGTGSCCYGRAAGGRTAKMGGWGHMLGDKASGYEIGLRALKAAVFYFDRDGTWSRLGQQLLRTLQLNEPEDLIRWAQSAGKTEIAALTMEVFAAAARGDRIARDILEGASASLANDAVSCATKLLGKTHAPVRFVLAGSVLLKQPRFSQKIAREIKTRWPGASVTPLKRESAWGAVALAQTLVQGPKSKVQSQAITPSLSEPTPPAAAQPLSPTERRNPRSMHLDRMSTR